MGTTIENTRECFLLMMNICMGYECNELISIIIIFSVLNEYLKKKWLKKSYSIYRWDKIHTIWY